MKEKSIAPEARCRTNTAGDKTNWHTYKYKPQLTCVNCGL